MKRKPCILHKTKDYQNVREIISDAVSKYPNNIAFKIKIKKDKEVTYRDITYTEFDNEIKALGTELIRIGLKDEKIAIISKNRYEWMLSYIGIINGVGIAVPLDRGLPEQEIVNSLQRSGAKAVIFEEALLDIMSKIRKEKSTELTTFICMDNINDNTFIKLSDLLTEGKKEVVSGNKEYIDAKIDNNKMSVLLFTSGTTALAKGVMLSHRNIASNVYALNSVETFYETDVNFALLPFHHTFGSTGIIFILSYGACNVFCDGLRYIQDNLKEYGVTAFIGVPLILESMHKKVMAQVKKQGKEKKVKFAIALSNFLLKFHIDIRRKLFKEIIDNLGGLRAVVSGAAGLDKTVAKDFNAWGIKTVQGYGLTETSPVVSAENDKYIKYGSVGFPMCNVELKIDEPDKSGIGEIVVKGPNVMLGYYNDKKATDAVLKDGWFYTGDLGYIDKQGYVYITGRKKNVIVLQNGKNIYPEELELLINRLPYVAESMVFGYPKGDDLIVSAKIVYNKDYIQNTYDNISEKELEELIWNDIKEINANLTIYKHIKKLILTDKEMIKTTTSKVKRFEEISKVLTEMK